MKKTFVRAAVGAAMVLTACGGSGDSGLTKDGANGGGHASGAGGGSGAGPSSQHGGTGAGTSTSTSSNVGGGTSTSTASGGAGPTSSVSTGGGTASSTVAASSAATTVASTTATTTTTTTTATTGSGGGACDPSVVFPANNPWNTDISSLPKDANSDNYITFINNNGGNGPLHADFDSCCGDGIPFNVVDNSVAKVPVSFVYASDSDPGPYPIPANPKIENGGDAHLLMLDTSECKLYELWSTSKTGGSWHAGSGAIFDLGSNALRHDCWTSADAAGLPIYAGLVRYAEVASGQINHALRFTLDTTRKAWIHPATHQAGGSTSVNAPPMGLRFRLKSSAHVNGIIATAGPQAKVVLVAMQKYGMFLADNGSNWYVSGEPNAGWDDDAFHASFDQITSGNATPGSGDFEVVQAGAILTQSPALCN